MLAYQREQYIQALRGRQGFVKLPVSFVGFRKGSKYSFDLKHATHIVTSYEAYQNPALISSGDEPG